MIALLIASIILGLIVGGITGWAIIGLIAGGALFVCGLPAALLIGFIHSEIDYIQSRADLRAKKLSRLLHFHGKK